MCVLVVQIYQEYLQCYDLQSHNPDGNIVTFYEHNNSGPQAGLGKAVDMYIVPPICTTEHSFFQVIALVDVFLSRNIVLTLLSMIEAPLSFSVKDFVTHSVPPQVTHVFKR